MGIQLQASKKHYCVHPVSSTSPNLEEECEKMLSDRSCRFFLGAHQLDSLHITQFRVCFNPSTAPNLDSTLSSTLSSTTNPNADQMKAQASLHTRRVLKPRAKKQYASCGPWSVTLSV